MILLEPTTANTVSLSLAENSELATPYYLFELISDDSNVSTIFTAANVSTNKLRYDSFVITTTTGAEDLLNGVIKLVTKGYYTYNVYDQVSATNLDLANITSLVEVGKVYFNKSGLPTKIGYDSQVKTKNVYNG